MFARVLLKQACKAAKTTLAYFSLHEGSALMKDGDSFPFLLLIFACLPINLFFV